MGTAQPVSAADVVIAATAALSLMVSLVALVEAWRQQRTAAVEAFPVGLDDDAYLGVQFENYGPAVARRATIHVYLEGDDRVRKYEQSRTSPVLAPGQAIQIPMGFAGDGRTNLADLAATSMSLVIVWTWTDERSLLTWRVQHRSQARIPLATFLSGLSEALSIVPLDAMVTALYDVSAAVREGKVANSTPGTAQRKASPKRAAADRE